MFRILAVDGGGVRGIYPAHFLDLFEQQHSPIAEHFDLLVGTSTGAIVAAAAAMRLPMNKVARLYEQHASKIFTKQRWSFAGYASSAYSWFMNQNSYVAGMYSLPNPSLPPTEAEKWFLKASADMNGDNQQDLIWQRRDGYIAVWLMSGTTLVEARLLYPTPIDPDWQIVGAGDLDRDGQADLLWQRQSDGRVSGWKMSGPTFTGTGLLLADGLQPSNNSWQIRAVTDVSGDGYRDLVWYKPATGHVSVWILGWQNDRIQMAQGGFTPAAYSWIQDLTWRLVGAK